MRTNIASKPEKWGRRKTLALSVAAVSAAFALGSGGALGQDAAEEIEEITVTGSRIRTTSGFEASTPVTSMSVPELFDFEPGNTISEQLDALPQFFNTSTTQRGGGLGIAVSGQGGKSSLNLRNLSNFGSSRTLVLLDSSRVMPTDKNGSVNVDLLPTALMRSVDVVTGGASAAYGADALSGVVNFVLDREFEGLDIKVGGGQLEGGEGKQWEVEIAGGFSLFNDRFHVIGAIQEREIDQISEGDRDRIDNFRRIGFVTNPEWFPGAPEGIPQRLTLPNVAPTDRSPTGLIFAPGTPLHMMQFTTDAEDIVPFVFGDVSALPRVPLPGAVSQAGTTESTSGGPEAERAFQVFDTLPDGNEAITRSQFLGLQFDVTDRLSLYIEGRGGRSESNVDAVRGAGGLTFAFPWDLVIAQDNAFLPENVRQLMIDNGLDEIRVQKSGSFLGDLEPGSITQDRNVFTQWQWGWGFEYQIPGVEWALQGSWHRGRSKRNSQSRNFLRVDRMFLAMDAVRDPETGAIVCRVQTVNPTVEQLRESVEGRVSSEPVDIFLNPVDLADPKFREEEGLPDDFTNTKPLESPIGLDNTIRDCVPFNMLGAGNATPEAMEFMHTDKALLDFLDQDFAEVLVTGDLFNIPAGPVSFAAGLTWRDEQFIDRGVTPAGTGVGGKVVRIEELGPPINVPELGIRGIPPGFSGGSPNLNRFSTTPQIAGQKDVWEWFWELQVPVWESNWGEDLLGFQQRVDLNGAFRQSDYDRSGDSSSWKVGVDFRFHRDWRLRWTRSRDVREPNFAELFDASGSGPSVTDPRFNNTRFSITAIIGGNPNLAPEEGNTRTAGIVWQPTFAPWIDGLQISVDWWDIEVEGQIDRLGAQRIVNECEINGLQCDNIQREEGVVTRVIDTFQNLSVAAARGADLELQWRAEPNLFANQLETFSFRWLASYMAEKGDAPLGGVFDSSAGSQGTPRYTHTMTANYGIGPWIVQLQNRFVNGTVINSNWRTGVDVDRNNVASMSWWNARVGYQDELANGATWSVNFNIQNAFDRDPPVVPGGTGGQGFGNRFDVFGRRYNLSANYSF